jgi:hypothetical protein
MRAMVLETDDSISVTASARPRGDASALANLERRFGPGPP